MFIINCLNLLSSFQQGNFTKSVRPKGNCKDINLSVLLYFRVTKTDTRIRWSIYQMILAWIVIRLLNPLPFHYNTCNNSHQRGNTNYEERPEGCRMSWPCMTTAGSQLELPKRDKAVVTATQQVLLQQTAETLAVWNWPGRFLHWLAIFLFLVFSHTFTTMLSRVWGCLCDTPLCCQVFVIVLCSVCFS